MTAPAEPTEVHASESPFVPGVLTAVTPQVSVLLAPNPGPMTLEGTNTWVIRSAPGARSIVIDPGPADAEHLERLLEAGPIGLILVTHEHADHTEAVQALHDRTGAPVRGASAVWCRGADPLRDDEEITVDGATVRVLLTPGHTLDSVCVAVLGAQQPATVRGAEEAVCTGDTLLGRGTTLVPHPGGSLAAYLRSLRRLREFGAVTMLPGHGPVGASLREACDRTLEHRQMRLDQVAGLLGEWSCEADPKDEALVERVLQQIYSRVPAGVVGPARSTIRAQLAYLRESSEGVLVS